MTLLQMSMSAAILIIIITVLRAVSIHKLPKKTFLFLWGLVFFRLLFPISIPSVFSVYSWIPQGDMSYISEPSMSKPQNYSPRFSDTSYIVADNITTNVGAQGFSDWSTSLWTVLWFIGFLLCVLYFITAYRRGMKKFKNALPLETAFIKEWKENHPLKRTLSIQSSDQVSTPLSYGILKPVILIPRNLDFENTEVLNYILTHEYVHIRHFDILTKMLMMLAVSIHWFNPMVWVMYLLLNRDIELICDETVIKLFGEKNKSSYAHILIDMEIQKAGLMLLCNNFSKNATQERISAIMKTRKTSFFMIVLATILFMGVTVGFATSAKKNDDTIQTSSNHTICGEIDKNLEKIQIDINSAAIDFIELEGKQNIFAEFDPAYYEVNIQNKKRIISVKINSKTGNNNALPIKLYIPSKFSQYIDMNVKNGSVDMNGIFANSKFAAKIESSNIDFIFNESFAGVFDADVKDSSMNFVSMNNYKNFEIDITSNNAIVDMPDYFKKTENKYTYSNGNKDAKIKLILDEYSVADFQ